MPKKKVARGKMAIRNLAKQTVVQAKGQVKTWKVKTILQKVRKSQMKISTKPQLREPMIWIPV
jgi:hypothetical protein